MTPKFLNIALVFLLIIGMASCYVEQTNIVKDNTTFKQKHSKKKIEANTDNDQYSEYYHGERIPQKRITEIILEDGDKWKVEERFYKSAQNYYETKHSIPEFKNRKNDDILYGTYYLLRPDFEKSRAEFEKSKVNDSTNRYRRGVAGYNDSWYFMKKYSLEFDSTGHFIKSVSQPTSDSPVPPHLYFGKYQLKGDTLELLTFGRKIIRTKTVKNNKVLYTLLLLEPKKEKYLMNSTRDILVDVKNKLYVPVKKQDTLRNLPINKDFYH